MPTKKNPAAKKNSVRTSKDVASTASEVLNNKKSSTDAKTVAGSALSNRRKKNK